MLVASTNAPSIEVKFFSFFILLFRTVFSMWNPIIPGWNPDPAILRVGTDYYIATSTFEYYPGIAIYHSKTLGDWKLISHALTRPSQLQLYGLPTGAGAWAPGLSYINNTFYLACMTRWVYDPVARVFPRIFYVSSPDLINWSDPVWTEPWGIDPELFQDPVSGKTYLNHMAVNNNEERLWGIAQCEIDLASGKAVGQYRRLWNGTLEHTSAARPEGPKMSFRKGWYYLLIAEGGTDDGHRATVARSRSPEGPFESNPNNPLVHNGGFGPKNLTVQSTGHATMVDTPDGKWYATFLARRNINGSSPLGRETFMTRVTWKDDWPVFNDGKPILLSEPVMAGVGPRSVPEPYLEQFLGHNLDKSWYQLRTPYTQNFRVDDGALILTLNVYGLSDRDVPAAVLRKQISLNMSFSATLKDLEGSLARRNRVGISTYLSEFQHQDIGVRGSVDGNGLCIYTELRRNGAIEYSETPLKIPEQRTIGDLVFYIRAEPQVYALGYSFGEDSQSNFVASIESSWQAFAPTNYFVFTGASFALFATSEGEPWPVDGPELGFTQVKETYYEENIPDYDKW